MPIQEGLGEDGAVMKMGRRGFGVKVCVLFVTSVLLLSVPIASANIPPVADADPDYQTVFVGETVYFEAINSSDPDGKIVFYGWEFGDGYGDDGNNIFTSHVYTYAGLFEVTLIVRDDQNDSDTDTVWVNVYQIPGGDPAPMIEVLEPGGSPGQTYFQGDIITVLWNASDDDPLPLNPINITYGNPTIPWMTIATDELDDGIFLWDTTGVAPGTYVMRISVYDSIGQTTFDTGTYHFYIMPFGDQPPGAPELLSAILTGTGNEDVEINWALSADDGGNENDVVGYEVYYSTTYSGDGSGYSLLASLSPGITTYTHSGAGDGDSDNYFYYVQAVDAAGQTGWEGQAGKYVRELRGGHKEMVSIPLVQADTSIQEVIKTISGSYHSMMMYQGSCGSRQWKVYKPGWDRDFNIDHKMGFFIKVLKDDDLVVAGLVPESTTITLCHDTWNLIGYPSFTPDTVGDVLSSISHKGVKVITQNRPQHMMKLSDGDVMSDGNGYWVKVLNGQALMINN